MTSYKPTLCFLFLFLSGSLLAQQDAQFSQYMYNTALINSAYIGSRTNTEISGLYRSQWTGIDGAPTTQTFNISSPFTERTALGFRILNDEIGNGTYQNTDFSFSYSYSIPFRYAGRLSFGINAGASLFNIDYNRLRNLDAGVPGNLANIDRKFSPNFGLGVYYNTDNYYFGISAPSILETEHFDDSNSSGTFLAQERIHFNFIAGYVYEINPELHIKPAVLARSVSGSPLAVDISGNLIFNYKFRVGASYRVGADVSALFGIDLSDRFLVGLAYDRQTTGLGDVLGNDGSFEFFLRYSFKSYKNFVSPCCF